MLPNVTAFRFPAFDSLPFIPHQALGGCLHQLQPPAPTFSSLAASQPHTTLLPALSLSPFLAPAQPPSTSRSPLHAPFRASRTRLLHCPRLQSPFRRLMPAALGRGFNQVSHFLLSFAVTGRTRYHLHLCSACPAPQARSMQCRDHPRAPAAPPAATARLSQRHPLQPAACALQAHTATHQGRPPPNPAHIVPQAPAPPLKAPPPACRAPPVSIPPDSRRSAPRVQREHFRRPRVRPRP